MEEAREGFRGQRVVHPGSFGSGGVVCSEPCSLTRRAAFGPWTLPSRPPALLQGLGLAEGIGDIDKRMSEMVNHSQKANQVPDSSTGLPFRSRRRCPPQTRSMVGESSTLLLRFPKSSFLSPMIQSAQVA